ncbi:MAG: D-alanyl-D-alanine carboxypeptidase/D-alanyl-D-alanine-endopeptidase [Blastocatellia bacterium]|nr:D-alanyl-D-alanine carboxypeptidase/D-alanyl-D-alanine-endopeptidase [Blastocatellia bacterium]
MLKLKSLKINLALAFGLSFIVTGFAAQDIRSQITTVPSPTPAASPKTAVVVPQTLADLQSGIRTLLAKPVLRRGQVGVKITSLNSGRTVFEQNAEKYFMPASNMKNFTVAAALEKLTPDFRFITSVYAAALPDSVGTVKGDLRIYGRGDVSISTSFADGNYYRGLDDLADKIVAAGVKRIEGSIVADDSYFKGNPIPGSWEWDDLQWYYGAEVSALPLNDNAIDLAVRPGPVGYACTVNLSPYNPVYRVKNLCMTTASGAQRTLKIEKILGQNQLEITGTLPFGNAGFTGSVTVSRPAGLFAALLKQRLEQKGVTISGQFRTQTTGTLPPLESVEIAKLESPPLSLIASKTMKVSQNMYTETLLWTLGEEERKRIESPAVSPLTPNIPKDSSEIGIGVVKTFLTGIGVSPDEIVQHDGSGLSRHNLITPNTVVQLYTYMSKQSKHSQAWRDSLTIGGVDGTLGNRFKGTAAAGNIRGKTGTIDQVSALSGYIKTGGGEQLILSLIVNGVPVPGDRTALIDEIVLSLANFNGKID